MATGEHPSRDVGALTKVDDTGDQITVKRKILWGPDGSFFDVTPSTPFPVALQGSDPIPPSAGRSSTALARHTYSGGGNVSTSAYTELVTALPDDVNELFIFDSSGQTLVLATGAAGFEVDQIYITPGGNGSIELAIASGARVSIKAVSANATAGEINVSFLK